MLRLEKIAQAKPDRVILRDKQADEKSYCELAERANAVFSRYGIPLGAYRNYGITKNAHIPLPLLREEGGRPDVPFGTSVHSAEEAAEAEKMGAEYIIAGHIFATDCKKGLAPRGLDFLKKICDTVEIPVYAIGGINSENIASVKSAGADGACIMSGFMSCEDPVKFIEKLRERV